MNFITAGITIISIAIVAMAAFHSMGLMLRKLDMSQVARKYILVMETKGCLTGEDSSLLLSELEQLGFHEVDITGTTQVPVGYGETIWLKIRGKVRGIRATEDLWNKGFGRWYYYVEESRMSTAKN